MSRIIVGQRSSRQNVEQGWEAILRDMTAVIQAHNSMAREPIYLSGPRVLIPTAGTVLVSIISNVATAGSTALLNHVIGTYRNGQPMDTALPISTWTGTTASEWAVYSMRQVASGRVVAGDEIRPYLTVTGAPAPTLTSDNITILCALTPDSGQSTR